MCHFPASRGVEGSCLGSVFLLTQVRSTRKCFARAKIQFASHTLPFQSLSFLALQTKYIVTQNLCKFDWERILQHQREQKWIDYFESARDIEIFFGCAREDISTDDLIFGGRGLSHWVPITIHICLMRKCKSIHVKSNRGLDCVLSISSIHPNSHIIKFVMVARVKRDIENLRAICRSQSWLQ